MDHCICLGGACHELYAFLEKCLGDFESGKQGHGRRGVLNTDNKAKSICPVRNMKMQELQLSFPQFLSLGDDVCLVTGSASSN
jgi:hypothetical protein